MPNQGFTEELPQAPAVHLVVRHRDHRFVGGELRQAAGIDTVDFKKIQRCMGPGPLVSVEEGLALSDVIGVGACNLVQVAVAVEVDVDGLGYGRFQSAFVPHTVQSAKLIDLVPVDFVNLHPCQKNRLLLGQGEVI
jgi:hypothetical protein